MQDKTEQSNTNLLNRNILTRCAVSALLIVFIIASSALTVYFANQDGFSFWLSDLLTPLSIFSLILWTVLFLLQFPLYNTFYTRIACYVLFSCGVLLYFQSNWFLWDLGPLVNGEFWWDWNEHGRATIIEAALYIFLIGILVWQRKWLSQNLVKMALIIMGIQLLVIAPNFFSKQEEISYKNYVIDESQKFEFAKENNIILCVLDCYTPALLEEIFRENPESKEIFKDFTLYNRVLSETEATEKAIFAFFTGEQFPTSKERQSIIAKAYNEQKSSLKKLKKQNFRCEIYPWGGSRVGIDFNPELIDNITLQKKHGSFYQHILENRGERDNLIKGFLLRLVPLRIKGLIVRKATQFSDSICGTSQSDLTRKLRYEKEPLWDFISSNIQFYKLLQEKCTVGNTEKVFKYYHLKGAHDYFDHDDKLNPTFLGGGKSSLQMQGKRDYINQGKGCILIMQQLIEELKRNNLYDKSTIIFTGDHGRYDFLYGLSPYSDLSNPMLLVKQTNEKHDSMVSCDNVILQTDICNWTLWNTTNKEKTSLLGSDFSADEIRERQNKWDAVIAKNDSRKYYKIILGDLKSIDFSHAFSDSNIKFYDSFNIPELKSGMIQGWFRFDSDYYISSEVEVILVEKDSSRGCVGNVNNWTASNITRLIEENCNSKQPQNKFLLWLTYLLDISKTPDGEYELYFSSKTQKGVRYSKVEGCTIKIINHEVSIIQKQNQSGI